MYRHGWVKAHIGYIGDKVIAASRRRYVEMQGVVIGAIKINSVASGSNVQIGDAGFIYLTSSCKVYTGTNSLSPGDAFNSTTTALGNVNTVDPDVVDMPNTRI
jgi:spore germination protein PA